MIKGKLLTALFTVMLSVVVAQNIPQPGSTNNVTDDQLRQAMQKASQMGLSPAQIESMARSKGYSQTEINEIKKRMGEVQYQQDGLETDAMEQTSLRYELEALLEKMKDYRSDSYENEFDGQDQYSDSLYFGQLKGEVYGSSLFNIESQPFLPNANIPTPEDYVLGPGDELRVDVWGASEITYQLLIGTEGNVFIPNLGPIFLSGLKIDQARKKVVSRLSKIYAGLTDKGSQGVNTYAQISLGRTRSINVNIIGQAKQPGSYVLSSFSTILHALYQCGGPTFYGSFRDIKVFRNNQQIVSFDIYDFLFKSDLLNNIILENDDILVIPTFKKHVKVVGEVVSSEIFDIKEDETLEDLFEFTSGFTDVAYQDWITISRKTSTSRKIVTVKNRLFASQKLMNGDVVSVAPLLDIFENKVSIQGSVWRPGDYEFEEGMTLKELIVKAEGLTGDAYLKRGQILRTKEDLTLLNMGFDVNKIIKGTDSLVLNSDDIVIIKSSFDVKPDYLVRVLGEVKNPGHFAYNDSLTVEDLLYRAGGFSWRADKSFVEIARVVDPNRKDLKDSRAEIFTLPIDEDLGMANSKFILKPYDWIIVRKNPIYEDAVSVELEGEVKIPGYYILKDDYERISDVIRRAGGLTNAAYANGAILIRRSEYFELEDDMDESYDEIGKILRINKGLDDDKRDFINYEKIDEQYNKDKPTGQRDIRSRMGDSDRRNGYDNKTAMGYEDGRMAMGYEDDRTAMGYGGDSGVMGYDEKISARSKLKREELERLFSSGIDSVDVVMPTQELIAIDLLKLLEKPGSTYDLELRKGDIISVPRKMETVRVRGGVSHPSLIIFDRSKTFKKYVTESGGFAQNARRSGSYVIYANGSSKQTSNFIGFRKYPKIEPGTEIVIPRKEFKSPQETLGLTSALVATALLTLRLIDFF